MFRVLHVFSSYGGGISSLVLNLVTHSDQHFVYDTLAYSYQGGSSFVNSIEKQGGSCYLIPRISKEGLLKQLLFLKDFFSINKYDCIHCHISGIDALIFYRLAKKYNSNIKFIVHAHTTRYDFAPYRNALMRRFNEYINYKISDYYLYCSDLAAEYIFNRKYLKKKKSYFIANGIDENKFDFDMSELEIEKLKNELGIPKGNKVLIHIGRFTLAKNHVFLLEIFHQVQIELHNVSLILVGTGELYDSVVDKVKEMNIENNVFFLGRRTDIPQLLKISDIALLPSLYEGLPTVGIECQAAGTPMILSDNITKQTDLKLGLLKFISIDCAENWKNEILFMLKNLEYRQKNCLNKVKQRGFTSQIAGKEYCNLLEKIITGCDVDKE